MIKKNKGGASGRGGHGRLGDEGELKGRRLRTGSQVLGSRFFTGYFLKADMEFVQNFTPPDFQAKNFTPSISPNFNSFSKKKHKK